MKGNNNLPNNKIFIIRKDKDYNDILYVKENFEKSDKYLNINPKFLIGSLSNYFLKKKEKRELKEELQADSPKSKKKNRNKRMSRLLIKEDINMKSPYLLSYDNKNSYLDRLQKNKNKNLITDFKDKSENIHYKYKSFEDLQKIFSAFKKREKDSKMKGTNDLIPIKTSDNVKDKYQYQEKLLKYNSVYKSKSEKYIHNLAKRCKKNESQMLVNNVQNYRMKKQIKEYMENNKILAEKFGDYYWLFSLRRPPKNDFTRLDFFNIGTNEREIWKRYMDYPDKDVEIINLPYSKYKKNLKLYTEINKDNEDKIPKINEFDDIKIEGKNLVKKEYKDIVDSYNNFQNHIKFKIYKEPKEKKEKYVKDLIYKEIYKLKKNKNSKKMKIKFKLLNK